MLWSSMVMDCTRSLLSRQSRKRRRIAQQPGRPYVPIPIWKAYHSFGIKILISHDSLWFLSFLDFQDDQQSTSDRSGPAMSLEEIKQATAAWVSRCQTGAAIFLTLWVGWIVAAQVLRNADILPSSWFILDPSNSELTGW